MRVGGGWYTRQLSVPKDERRVTVPTRPYTHPGQGNDDNFGDRYATTDPTLAAMADGKIVGKPGPKPRGRNLCEVSKAERDAHQAEMLKKHTER